MTAPVLMSNLAPCQGQVTSAPSTVPSDSGPPRWVHVSLSAWTACPTRKRAIFWPSSSGSVQSSTAPSFSRFPQGSPASVLRRARLDPGVVDEELLVQRDEVF